MAGDFQEILSVSRAAMQTYDMIAPGDRVAVGVSGGKDSMVLLAALARLREFYPVPFSVTAVTLDPGFGGEETDYRPVTAWCEARGIPHVIRRTRLWEVIFVERQEANPCSLCARMRRGALHVMAQELGCGTVALGHHKTDAAETFLMNLLSGGTLGCFSPKTYLDRRQLTLIRPLVFADEEQIGRCARREGLPIVKSRCPVDGCTSRQQAKELLDRLSASYGPVADKILTAMQKKGLSGW